MHDPLIQAGLADGVPYNFEAIARTPNTLDAHRLIRWAHTTGLQNEMAERLFMSYWSEGKDIGDRRSWPPRPVPSASMAGRSQSFSTVIRTSKT